MNSNAAPTNRYIAKFDTNGFEGTLKVNGIAAVSRKRSARDSGAAVLNPLLKKGKNSTI